MAGLKETGTFMALCLFTVLTMVFLTASQPFLLTTLFPNVAPGSASGKLSLVDELTVICSAPIWGSLADKYGVKKVAAAGMLLLSLSLERYPLAPTFFPWLLLLRAIFALGVACLASMMTALLSHYTEAGVSLDRPNRQNAHMAGMVGLFSGIGAVLAVVIFLPLPVKLSSYWSTNGPVNGIKLTHTILAALLCLLTPFLWSWLPPLHENPDKVLALWDGFKVAKNERDVRLGYYGSAAARALSVLIALFIPLWTENYYRNNNLCVSSECRPAVIKAAILTGIANTATLLVAPLTGFFCARFGARATAKTGTVLAMASALLMYLLPTPLGALPIFGCISLGITQMLLMTSSLTLCSSRTSTAGGVAGVASLCGSLGALVLTQLGSYLADELPNFPFMMMLMICIPLNLL